eukprot:Blabericola_migrator_1__12581@NODE_7_length_25668_cov_124_338502_g6_i0_p4_GENE_NODE_7_length_25668_cov_124_338502_g6_i0NODE_7_length_25668_cov_124_338502_g6_i0_p4_ORF_typecomplete_len746_score130_95Flavi_DEAD/PF07652_14/1_2e30HA2/PF04408_23/1_7e28OB_NTP_bind/PF07717_16/3_3e18DEAD/PF00270_29/1_3e15Helicase_C/PF00271_31/4_4e11AAA_22/PF13401_6/2_1e10AAA_19/PF13245_6/6_7e09SRP54/PF00448_22/1_1e06ResIII/PF04851_15/7_4e05Herpes_ori_bp/PF02399_15/2_9e05AAA_30/PF13604_6/0_00091PPV_E1_C/PF00519_17/0_0013
MARVDISGLQSAGDEKRRKRKRFDDPPPGFQPEVPPAEVSEAPVPTPTPSDPLKQKKRKYVPEVPEGYNPLTNVPYSARYYELLAQRQKLPAFEARKQFLKTVKKNQCVVLVGETGSGKTTQCAQFLIDAGYHKGKCIACTQPRRVAAMSVARRVAEEMDVPLGQQVGYRIRFEDVCTPGVTLLKYCTDGSLLREAQTNPSLDNYSIVMLDEAHERTLDTDILFGLLKEIIKARTDLKVIVMSATLDAGKFQDYFQAPVITIPGRVHPVEIFYTPKPEEDYFTAAQRTVLQIHATEKEGDILLFLTGEEEILDMKKALEQDSAHLTAQFGELVVIPLYSTLPPQQQQKIFDPPPAPKYPGGPKGRKCIVSTNIAETSITIDGIVYVIDPGFAKQKVYDPRKRIETLLSAPISQASAKQRAGRAGRTQPGKCFRLYTELTFNELAPQSFPEILRSNLNSVVLTLLKLGVEDLVHFDLMEPPAPETLMRALEHLHYLDALDAEAQITPSGELMAEFPLDPQLSKMLVESSTHKATPEAMIIASCLSVPNIFMRPRDQAQEADEAKAQFIHPDGDHLTLIAAFRAYKEAVGQGNDRDFCWNSYLHHRALSSAERINEQLSRIYLRLRLDVKSTERTSKDYSWNVRKAILSGFFMQVAHLQRGHIYLTVKENEVVALNPGTVLAYTAHWVVYHELVMTGKSMIRTVTPVEGDWLLDTSPQFFDPANLPDGEARRKIQSLIQQRGKKQGN